MRSRLKRPARGWTTWVVVGLACVVAVLAWMSPVPVPTPPTPAPEPPPRPAGGYTVPSGAALQPLLDGAADGAVLCLSPGDYRGPLVIRRPLTLWGPRSAVVRSDGTGHTIAVRANGVRLLGFSVDGSGRRPDQMDAAVHVQGEDVRVQGLRVAHALFGLVAEKSRRVAFTGNEIEGDADQPRGLRGDAVRLWETRDSVVAENRVRDSRDILIWYSSSNRVLHNHVQGGRYGTHFMYSSGSVVEGNRYLDNTVGVFIMYSRNVQVRDNLVAGAAEAGSMGVGLKESGNLVIENNRLLRNQVGLYLDSSPFQKGDSNTINRNLFALCQTGVAFHSSPARNTFTANTLRNNQEPVRVDGGGDALAVTWRGNAFDDYQGYDLDGDGYGDMPYELRSLANELVARHPDLSFFRGTSALGLVEAAGRVLPLFQPQPVLVDPQPRVVPQGP